MTSPRHRGGHTQPRPLLQPSRSSIGVAAAGVLVLSLLGVRALASGSGGGESPSSSTFTGVVTEFADDGAILCVRRQSVDAPFCDVFYVRPESPRVRVGDRVIVTTITSRAEDGSSVSGMLVAPVP